MRIKHVYDSSYVYHFVLNELYEFRLLDIKSTANQFDYSTTTIYKMIKKIDYNLVMINPSYSIVKVSPGKYMMRKVA